MEVVNACCEEWKAKLTQCESTCAKLTGNAQLLKTKIIDTSTLLSLHRQLQTKMKQANEEIAELKKQNATFQKQVEGEKRETESLKQQVEFLLASNAPTEAKLKDTATLLDATVAKLAEKEAYITQLEASVSASKEASLNYDKVVKESARWRTELSNRDSQYKEARKNAKAQQSTIVDLKAKVTNLTAELETANNTILSFDLELSMLKDKKDTGAICWESVEPSCVEPISYEPISHEPVIVNSMNSTSSTSFALPPISAIPPNSASSAPSATDSTLLDEYDFAKDLENSIEISVNRPEPCEPSFYKGSRNRLAISMDDLESPKLENLSITRIVSKERSPETSPPHKRTVAENRQRVSRSYDEPSPSLLSHEFSSRTASTPPKQVSKDIAPALSPPSVPPARVFASSPLKLQAATFPPKNSSTLLVTTPILPTKPIQSIPTNNISKNTTKTSTTSPASATLECSVLDAEMADVITSPSTQPLVPITNTSSLTTPLQQPLPTNIPVVPSTTTGNKNTNNNNNPTSPSSTESTSTQPNQPELTLPQEITTESIKENTPKPTPESNPQSPSQSQSSSPSLSPAQFSPPFPSQSQSHLPEWEETAPTPPLPESMESEHSDTLSAMSEPESLTPEPSPSPSEPTSTSPEEGTTPEPRSEPAQTSSEPVVSVAEPTVAIAEPTISAEPVPVPSEPTTVAPELVPVPSEPAPVPSEPSTVLPTSVLVPSEPAQVVSEPVQTTSEPSPVMEHKDKWEHVDWEEAALTETVDESIGVVGVRVGEVKRKEEKQTEDQAIRKAEAAQPQVIQEIACVARADEWGEEEQLEEGQIAEKPEEVRPEPEDESVETISYQEQPSPPVQNKRKMQDMLKKHKKHKRKSSKQAKDTSQLEQRREKRKRTEEVIEEGEVLEPESKKVHSELCEQHPIISSLLLGLSTSVELDPPLSPSLLPEDPIEAEWEVDKMQRPNEPIFDYLRRRISLVFSPPSPGLSLAAMNSCDDLVTPFYDILNRHMDMVVLAFLKVLHECNAPSKVETATLLYWQFFSFQAEKGLEFRNMFLNKVSEYVVHSTSFAPIAHLCELFAGICKSSGDFERFVFLAYKILRKNFNWKIRTLSALAQCWPDPLIGKGDNLPLLNTIENLVALCSSDKSNPEHQFEQDAYQSLRRACYWPCRNNPENVSLEVLVSDLTQALVRNSEDPDMEAREGMFPRRAEIVLQAFELVSIFKSRDWDWTFQTIMVPMWGILSPTNPKPPNLTPAILRLLGIVGRVYSSEQIVDIRSRIALVFTPYALQTYAFNVQVCAALSLFDLCKGDTQILAPCRDWYKALPRDKKNQIRHLAYLVDFCAK